ncbi:glycosyltransferase [Microbacterium sp. SD291]|uniref:glycosyltransferase n=1 Tax=Microbacterium sp. SD291 TaxID=2782007 RepID=UPI001A97254D|nr:glycosyltransferase [Microbacterium sp. SD291]MBO0980981.1 glycosyltransferase [Microbacterium sp. SD291]
MTDLVVVSLEAWDEVWRRNQYLVSGLLDADPALRVLFIEPADDPLHAVRRGLAPRFGRRLRPLTDRLWSFRPVKWLPRRLDARADSRLAGSAARAAARLGMEHPLLWINDPTAAGLARSTGWRTLYDMTDDWLAAERPAAELARIAAGEEWLLQNAAAVVACSPELARRKRPQRADIDVIRNAVDVDRYRMPMPRPADLPDGPYALYLGTLHRDRLDVELAAATARALHGHGRLALVGPDSLDAADTALLRDAGAVVLAARPRDAVPGYLQHADVLVVPHLVTPFTESLDPLKLYEYQAVGRPIVSTPVAGFREAPGVVLAEGDAFAGAVADAVPAKTRFPEAATVAAVDWSQRAAEFLGALRAVRG